MTMLEGFIRRRTERDDDPVAALRGIADFFNQWATDNIAEQQMYPQGAMELRALLAKVRQARAIVTTCADRIERLGF